ncbi:thioredoxin family protein [Coprinopsis cinerea okayama7|uniref:Thioredoxin family protein n=1 Tax=Coprinopsis cinerea (strain Okayama-7 / 130 / ATCC MYA-4618 / FGSC 9003) TaxID=240176 RepID=A8NFZ5_COPC7|nr:thioredoxin family protein [Coprinopsis cinerea okayama7\|eukprot:XP_001833438.1 thioredoxin family protein [Coprinopsis cinerea okayama7\
MTTPVKLYVYDLSNGMAKQLSRQLTGRQIDGIWHTSVVVFGKEVFYGQGISITEPGKSHHGAPLEILDMGETSLDEDTFDEYLSELKEHYTADKYHLLEFNCNSFTNDCIGFLTGGTIPSYIKDLPTDFLSTPFGASLRPTIDAMYRRPAPGAAPVPPPTNAGQGPMDVQMAGALLQAAAAMASQQQTSGYAQPSGHSSQATNAIAGPIHIITNAPNFNSFIKSHKAAVAFFTSQTCPPCRMIEPVFERLSEEKGVQVDRDGAGFAKIDLGVGSANMLAGQYGVRATPTFLFFLNGEKVEEVKGADAGELRTQVDLLLFQAYPPHPHTSIATPTIKALSLNPILFTQAPAIDTVVTKLSSFIDAATWPTSAPQTQADVKKLLSGEVTTYLKARFTPATPGGGKPSLPSAPITLLNSWSAVTQTLVNALPIESLFPLVDMWRLAFLDPAVGNWIASSPAMNPITVFLPKALSSIHATSPTDTKRWRNFNLTALRLLSNGFSSRASSNWLMSGNNSSGTRVRDNVTQILVPSLLHEDAAIRTAAASLAFNAAAWLQKKRVDAIQTGRRWNVDTEGGDEMAEWQVEMASAVVEAIGREKENEEVVHRLVACLAFLIRLSPVHDTQLGPLLEVLQAKEVVRAKLVKGEGWNTDGGLAKKDVRKLVEELTNKLLS